jgi:hypothetical protein
MHGYRFPTPIVPISWGELIDKITILEIKQEKITSKNALENINNELNALRKIVGKGEGVLKTIDNLKTKLHKTNKELWKIEDDIREKDKLQQFDTEFISLARSVYRLNDERAKTKKAINILLSSELMEEKSYKDFQST